MKRLRGLISVIRPEDCFLSGVAVWIGWAAAARDLVPNRLLPLILWVLSTFLLVGTLNILNDIGDLEIDRLIHKKRALASGKISLGLTGTYLFVMMAGSLLLAIAATVLLGKSFPLSLYFIGVTIGLAYEVKMKKIGPVGNITVAILIAFPFLLGGSIHRITGLVIVLCSMAFVTGLAKEIINSVKDLEGDRGLRWTLPQWIGVKASLVLSGILLILTMVLTLVPILIRGPVIPYILLITLVDAILLTVIVVSFKRPILAHNLHSMGMALSMPAFLMLTLF